MDRLNPEVAAGALPFDAWRLPNDAVALMRPASAADRPLMQALVGRLSTTSRYRRFFYPLSELPAATLERFTHADPLGEMSLLVIVKKNGREVAIGMAQYVANADASACEFALVVDDAWQRNGIASRMLAALIDLARAAGLQEFEGEVLADNQPMLQLLARHGFSIGSHADGAYLRRARRALQTPAGGADLVFQPPGQRPQSPLSRTA
jgi:RimJ/RimL family protein N-acetyltransferase